MVNNNLPQNLVDMEKRINWFPHSTNYTNMDEHRPLVASYQEVRIHNRNSDELETKKVFGEIEEIEDEVERRFNGFKNFDIVRSAPHDHHYSMHMLSPKQTFTEKIEREWRVLEKNLPNSTIFVRAYERRTDLMRAALVGLPGTPYEHGLFFFDIFFPRNYPSSPPKIHYHNSHGLDLNPNLRPHDGKVCLRLIEPWYERLMHAGYCEENGDKWNPRSSNILQVLKATQDLISSSGPYSLSSSSDWERKYNKRAYLLTCQKMILDMEEPPKGFEDLVAGHFRRRAHPILLRLKENLDENDPQISHLYMILLEVFEKNGAYCQHHLDVMRSRKLEYMPGTRNNSSKSGSLVFKTVINRVKKNLISFLNY